MTSVLLNKMKLKKETIILGLIFLSSFIFQVWYSLKVSFFSSDEAYFNLRNSEYIIENFVPIFFDKMSYGGNFIANTHLFHYFLALFDLIGNEIIVYKIIPALMASSLIIIVYLIAKKITNNEYAALFSALLSAFIPEYISNTLNQISILSLFVPLFFLVIYLFIDIKENRKWFLFVATIFILLEPLNFLMISTFVLFSFLIIAESKELKIEELEAMGFFLVFIILVNLIMYKKIYFEQGIGVIWQNLPLELYGSLFQDFNIISTIGLIGFAPLLMGIIGFVLVKERTKTLLLLIAILLATFSLLLLKLIPFNEGLLFLAIILCISSALSFERLMEYLKITKLDKYASYIIVGIVLISLISLYIPSISAANRIIDYGVTAKEIEALNWIKFNTPHESIILGNVYEGNLIINEADRINIIDTQFFYAEDRIKDVELIFTTESLFKADKALKKYKINYIYFSEKTKEMYNVEDLKYTMDENCFKEVFKNEFAIIYKVVC